MNRMEDFINRYPILASCEESIQEAIHILISTWKEDGTLYLCGNGGSAADAEHISGELLKSFLIPRPVTVTELEQLLKFGEFGENLALRLQGSLPAVPISSFTALCTATVNDNDSDLIFAQSAWGLVRKQDSLLCLSTSGNSMNVIYAAIAAKAKGAKVIALTGAIGGKLKQYADVCICVPEDETFKIQEYHLPIYHYLCAELEQRFFGIC